MPENYVPIFIFALVAFLVAAGTLAIFALIRPHRPSAAKLMPYECGITPFDDARVITRFLYIVAILFVVFDGNGLPVPWRCSSRSLASSDC